MQGIDRCTRSCVALKYHWNARLRIRNSETKVFTVWSTMSTRSTLRGKDRLTFHFFFNDILYGFVVDTLKIISDLGLEYYVLTYFILEISLVNLSGKASADEVGYCRE